MYILRPSAPLPDQASKERKKTYWGGEIASLGALSYTQGYREEMTGGMRTRTKEREKGQQQQQQHLQWQQQRSYSNSISNTNKHILQYIQTITHSCMSIYVCI